MDDVEQLMQGIQHTWSDASPASKLDVLMDLERRRDRRVVPFLLHVLADPGQPSEVRVHVLKRLRNGPLAADDRTTVGHALSHLTDDRSTVGQALSQLMSNGCNLDLRLQAVLALGEFTDVNGVLPALGSLALEPQESIDLRYTAFTSLERAGPTPECVNLLRQLSKDDVLGRSARSALVRWHLDQVDA
jgi:hypothetical protein